MNQWERIADVQEALQIKIEAERSNIWTCFPGKVVSFNVVKNTCFIQPMFLGVATALDGSATNISMPILPDCPIVFPSAGGYHLTFPIAVGDEVLVHVSSRNIDPWFGSGTAAPSNEFRMHDLSDCFCTPGIKSIPTAITNISTTSVQLRNAAGNAYVEIAGQVINIVTPAAVNINATGNVNVTAPTTAFTGNATISGNLTVTGTITNGVNLSSHRHSDPQGGVTGLPQ